MAKKVKMELVGLDGNAFVLMGAFTRNARKQGWTQEEIDVVINECKQGDYDHLLCTLMNNIADDDDDDDDDDEEPCRYCGGNCPNDDDNMCDGYAGDIDNLYETN